MYISAFAGMTRTIVIVCAGMTQFYVYTFSGVMRTYIGNDAENIFSAVRESVEDIIQYRRSVVKIHFFQCGMTFSYNFSRAGSLVQMKMALFSTIFD